MRWIITTPAGVTLGAVVAVTAEAALAEASRRWNIAAGRLRAKIGGGS